MNERELERVMRDFTSSAPTCCQCTTIIETGIDNPHANTILINRADKFGLAQLHQLRGRVGRSHHQAYAYLLVQDDKALTKQAKQRLEAIQMMRRTRRRLLPAMHDLKSAVPARCSAKPVGEMQEVGFNLSPTCSTAPSPTSNRARPSTPDLTQPLGISTEINLRTPGPAARRLLPRCPRAPDAVQTPGQLRNGGNIDAMQEELIDRFGELPLQGQSLLATHRLRLVAKPLCIQKLDATNDQITAIWPGILQNPPIETDQDHQFDPEQPGL